MEFFDKDALSIDVGRRLRELRLARNLSMRALASASGLSANALSMIERGKTSPSVSTLYKLSTALGVPITAFFSAGENSDDIVLVRHAERVRVPFMRGIWEGLGGEQFSGRVEPFLLTLESGANSGPHNLQHSGHEFVFCLRGQLEYVVENRVIDMQAGDSLLFAANLRHRWRNPGGVVTNVLFVLSDFDEDEHPARMHVKPGKVDDETEA